MPHKHSEDRQRYLREYRAVHVDKADTWTMREPTWLDQVAVERALAGSPVGRRLTQAERDAVARAVHRHGGGRSDLSETLRMNNQRANTVWDRAVRPLIDLAEPVAALVFAGRTLGWRDHLLSELPTDERTLLMSWVDRE